MYRHGKNRTDRTEELNTCIYSNLRRETRARGAGSDLEGGQNRRELARIARPTRGGGKNLAAATFKDTHFNDLVVDRATGVAVGVRRARKGPGAGHADTGALALAPAAAAVEIDGVAAVERATSSRGGPGEKKNAAVSAFDAAFERERVRAERPVPRST